MELPMLLCLVATRADYIMLLAVAGGVLVLELK